MNLEELRKRKMALGYTNEQIAQLSGVPLSTVQKIFAGVTQQPRYETLLALERVLDKGTDRVRESLFEYRSGSGAGTAGKKQGEYTLEDIKNLPRKRQIFLYFVERLPPAMRVSRKKFYLCVENKYLQ